MTNNQILKTSNLTIKHKGENILNNVDIEISKGEIVLLAGRNGSGKSTLLKCLAGVSHQDSGTISFKGEPDSRTIGFLPDNNSLYENYTIAETIKLHSRLHKTGKINSHLLDRLIPNKKKKVKDLSTGQKAILLISLIISQNPSLILMDEILQHIDPYIREQILNQLIDIVVANQTSLVIVNHYLDEIEKLPDRIILMNNGQIILDTTPDSILNQCKKIVSREKLEIKDLPIIHCEENGTFKEYYIYPTPADFTHPELSNSTLAETITSFIGGHYAN